MTVRNIARLGATGLLAVSALGLAGTPAFAADVDFGVGLAGTTIAADASGKFAKLTVTNDGTTKPEKVNVLFDFTKLEKSKVSVTDLGTCKIEEGTALCGVNAELIPAAGGSAELPIPLEKAAGASGAAGTLTVTVEVEGDANKANNTKTVDVSVGDNGVDLRVGALDVTTADKDGLPNDEPVAPGGVGSLLFVAVNFGDRIATGVKVKVKLPAQTSFAENFDGCTQTADKRTFTCDVPDAVLLPKDKAGKDEEKASFVDFLPVKVSPDAKGPVSLKGGTVEITALKETPFSARAAKAAPQEGDFGRFTAEELAALDVDLTDNTDGFAVLVAGPDAGQGGSDPEDDNDDNDNDNNAGGGNDDGGLPLTGPAGLAIGGTGLAVLVAGLVLFLTARRRRVVLVTPGDEK